MDLFDEACDLDPDAQQLMLRRLFARDHELGKHLAGLLEHDAKGSDVLPRGEGREPLASQPPISDVPSDRGSKIGESAIPRQALVGKQVGDWIVREHLGSGAVGAVYRVDHVADGRVGAMKFLKHVGLSDPNNLKRFRQEFRAISQLDHPGCLRVFEEGYANPGHFFVMEHVDGGDLRRLIGAETPQLLTVLEQIADALAYIHDHGIVHRDLKPANVLLARGNPPQPKIADFGIAKLEDSSSVVTGAGVVGSIDFLAPEQVLGKAVDQRTDLYALGCLIHVLFSQQPPFTGDNFERLRARVDSTPTPLHLTAPHAPRAMVALVAKLLARQPEDRPANARHVLHELSAMRRQPSIPDC